MKREKRMPATDARVHFGEVLRSLRDHDVIVERAGIPIAAVIDIDTYLAVREQAEQRQKMDALSVTVPNDADIERGLKAWRGAGVLSDEEADDMTEYIYTARERGSREYRVREPGSVRVADGE